MAEEVHKYGTDDGWHGVIKEGGEFLPEKDRYHLYIGQSRCVFFYTAPEPQTFLGIEGNSTETNEKRSFLPFRTSRKPRASPQTPNRNYLDVCCASLS
jgi:hypothetical protein